MNIRPEMVSVPREPRELLERLLAVYSSSPWPAWYDLAAALEATPAEDVRAVVEEPVATVVTTRFHSLPMIMSDGILKPGAVTEQKSAILHVDLPDLTPLYRHPQRPVVSEPVKVCECGPLRNITDGGHFPACTRCHRRLNK